MSFSAVGMVEASWRDGVVTAYCVSAMPHATAGAASDAKGSHHRPPDYPLRPQRVGCGVEVYARLSEGSEAARPAVRPMRDVSCDVPSS